MAEKLSSNDILRMVQFSEEIGWIEFVSSSSSDCIFRMIPGLQSRRYLEGDTRGDEKKDKSEEEENLEPVGREPDIPNLVLNKI